MKNEKKKEKEILIGGSDVHIFRFSKFLHDAFQLLHGIILLNKKSNSAVQSSL